VRAAPRLEKDIAYSPAPPDVLSIMCKIKNEVVTHPKYKNYFDLLFGRLPTGHAFRCNLSKKKLNI